MILKTVDIFKKNPIIILFFGINLIIILLMMFLLYPTNMNQLGLEDGMINYAAYGIFMLRLLCAILALFVWGLIFYTGFGFMISEAVKNSKISMNTFFAGLKKYFVRILLSSLLLMAIYIGISIVLSMLTVPFIVISAMGKHTLNGIVPFIPAILVVFTIPFVLLWYPAIYIDDARVIEGFVKGIKTGTKKYWKLLLILFVIYIPMLLYMILNYASVSKGMYLTPSYIIMLIVSSIMALFAMPMFFIIYGESTKHNNSPLANQQDNDQINIG